MNTLSANDRREQIILVLSGQSEPVSAATLASQFDISRQIVVGDIALLRAKGHQISSTPKGYLYHAHMQPEHDFDYIGIVACRHTGEQIAEELYTGVDFGGVWIDVSIEHSIYGQITAQLDVHSRYDADLFIEKVRGASGKPLSDLTGGIHLHRIGCSSESVFLRIENALREKGILLNQD